MKKLNHIVTLFIFTSLSITVFKIIHFFVTIPKENSFTKIDYIEVIQGEYSFIDIILAISVFISIAIIFTNILMKEKTYLKIRIPQYYYFFGNTFWSTIIHFSFFIIAIYFSVISSNLNDWISGDKELNSPLLLAVVIYLLSISIAFYALHHYSLIVIQKEENKKNNKAFTDKLNRLQEIVQLSPPGDFSKDLSEYVDIAEDFVSTSAVSKKSDTLKILTYLRSINIDLADPNYSYKNIKSIIDKNETEIDKNTIIKHIEILEKNIEEQMPYIRALLISYTRLSAFFDGKKPSDEKGYTYRANLMLSYNNKDKPIEGAFKYIPSICKGKEGEIITHYLSLDKNYSVKVNTDKKGIIDDNGNPKEFKFDDTINNFSIPFFIDDNKKQYNCFGAPRAISEVKCQFINDTQIEIDLWEKQSEPGKDIITEAKHNFMKDDVARSIISIPVQTSRYSQNHNSFDKVFGVVNIYCDSPDLMLGNEQKQQQFAHITTPLNISLARITSSHIIHISLLNALREIVK
ncbi:hypothetical protein [Photobacterium leiognathi]|uniref:hypothetical protein n=1 Tax=Photobacterium leiognathi TaxID=553611 RepID=UPI00298200AC|nr:hypothetical protein [Photobacterium leiognathi]